MARVMVGWDAEISFEIEDGRFVDLAELRDGELLVIGFDVALGEELVPVSARFDCKPLMPPARLRGVNRGHPRTAVELRRAERGRQRRR